MINLEDSMEVPQKINNRTSTWSSNPTSGYVSRKKEKNTDLKRYTFIAAHSQ